MQKSQSLNTLPQTGQDQHSSAAYLALGSIMLMGALVGAIISRKKKN